MENDNRVGLFLCATGAAAYAIAVSGWILIFSEVVELKTRIEGMREDCDLLAAEVRATVQKLELKLEVLSNQLDNLESLTRSGRSRAELPDTGATEMPAGFRQLIDHQALPWGQVR